MTKTILELLAKLPESIRTDFGLYVGLGLTLVVFIAALIAGLVSGGALKKEKCKAAVAAAYKSRAISRIAPATAVGAVVSVLIGIGLSTVYNGTALFTAIEGIILACTALLGGILTAIAALISAAVFKGALKKCPDKHSDTAESSHGQPAYESPRAMNESAYQSERREQPAPRRSYEEPAQPSYEEPTPAYEESSAYEEPSASYEQPSYEQPAYEEPAPSYEQPSYEQPAYEEAEQNDYEEPSDEQNAEDERARAREEAMAALRAEQEAREAANNEAAKLAAQQRLEELRAQRAAQVKAQREAAARANAEAAANAQASVSAEDVIAQIEKIDRDGATLPVMREVAMLLRKERAKPENQTPEQQKKLNEALAKLLRAMSAANKK